MLHMALDKRGFARILSNSHGHAQLSRMRKVQ